MPGMREGILVHGGLGIQSGIFKQPGLPVQLEVFAEKTEGEEEGGEAG